MSVMRGLEAVAPSARMARPVRGTASPSRAAATSAAIVTTLIAAGAIAGTQTFSGPLQSTRAAFNAAAGCDLKKESFDSFPPGSVISSMPGVDAVMTNEDANGNAIGFPIVDGNSPITPPNWLVNVGNGRPPFSPWVVRPIAGAFIHAFGQVNAQGDWVRVQGFDAKDVLVVSVDAPPIGAGAFAGFVTDVPVARVVVTPLGNFDGANGLDDLTVSIVPPEPCPADLNHDGIVDGADLGELLSAWGTSAFDLACDGSTDGADLGVLLAAWGACG